jgi:hypothetical protein
MVFQVAANTQAEVALELETVMILIADLDLRSRNPIKPNPNECTPGLCRNIDIAIRERCTAVMQEFNAERAIGIR